MHTRPVFPVALSVTESFQVWCLQVVLQLSSSSPEPIITRPLLMFVRHQDVRAFDVLHLLAPHSPDQSRLQSSRFCVVPKFRPVLLHHVEDGGLANDLDFHLLSYDVPQYISNILTGIVGPAAPKSFDSLSRLLDGPASSPARQNSSRSTLFPGASRSRPDLR